MGKNSKVDRELEVFEKLLTKALEGVNLNDIACYRTKLLPSDLPMENQTGTISRLAISEYFQKRFDIPFAIQNMYVVQFLETVLKIYTPIPQEINPPHFFACHDTTLNHKGRDYLVLLGEKVSSNISYEIAQRRHDKELLFPLQEDVFTIKEFKVVEGQKMSLYYFTKEQLRQKPKIPSLKSSIYKDFLKTHRLSDDFRKRKELTKALAFLCEDALGDRKLDWLAKENGKEPRVLTQEEVNSILIKKSS